MLGLVPYATQEKYQLLSIKQFYINIRDGTVYGNRPNHSVKLPRFGLRCRVRFIGMHVHSTAAGGSIKLDANRQ